MSYVNVVSNSLRIVKYVFLIKQRTYDEIMRFAFDVFENTTINVSLNEYKRKIDHVFIFNFVIVMCKFACRNTTLKIISICEFRFAIVDANVFLIVSKITNITTISLTTIKLIVESNIEFNIKIRFENFDESNRFDSI